jgi:hypothetical protein
VIARILLYYCVFNDAAKQFTTAGNTNPSERVGAGRGVVLLWRQRSKRAGVDVSVTYGELPPE